MVFVLLLSIATLAQKKSSEVKYISDTDNLLTINKLIILDFVDNSSGIYAKPLTDEAVLFFEKIHQWSIDRKENKFKTELLNNDEVKKTCSSQKTGQAVLSGRVVTGPQGLQIKLRLSLCQDGQVLLVDNTEPTQEFATDSIKKILNKKLLSMIERLPYQGVILSRRGQDVTINMGRFQGLHDGDIMNVVQIINLQRHPKQDFLVGHDKILLGQISISKVDDYLSFGQITMEKEPGVIQVSQKIKLDQFIQYALNEDGTWLAVKDKLTNRPEGDIAFGKKPAIWKSQEPPQYGALQMALGLIQYNQNVNFQSAGSIDASTSIAPTLSLAGEFWLNDLWFIDLGLKQSAFSVNNAYPSNSSPSSLNMSVSRYHLAGGYNLLLEDNNFWGSKLKFIFGLAQYSAKADRSSPNLFLSDQNFGGLYLGVAGDFPMSLEIPWTFGFKFKYYLTNTSSDGDSGSSGGVKINEFGFITKYTGKKGFNYLAELNFEYYNSDFSGGSRLDPITSSKHKITEVLLGLEYLF